MRLVALVLLIAGVVSGESTYREWQAIGGYAARTPMPFRAAGLYCEQDARARASTDGNTWSEWITVPHEHDGALVYFGELQRYLETDRDCRVGLIDAGVTTTVAVSPKQRARRAEMPPVVTREEWGCTPQTCPSPSAPSYTTVTHLVVHHSAGGNTSQDWPGVVRSIWVLHVRGNGWNDIGYNYLIDPNGVLYEGRAGGDGVLGAHFSGVNGGTMGVCMLGTFSALAPQTASMETLRDLLVAQALRWKLDPGGRAVHAASGLTLNVISGHRDAGLSARATSTTECPGNGVYTLLPALRREARALTEGDCPLEVSRPYFCAAGVGASVVVEYTLPEGCSSKINGKSDWIDVELGAYHVALHPRSNPGAARLGFVTLDNQKIEVAQSGAEGPEPPCIDFHGVLNSATFDERPLGRGAAFSVFGTGLTENAKVSINGREAAILTAEEGRINAVLPEPTNTGSARISITSNGLTSPERLIWVTESAPAIFFAEGPARAGDTVNVYLTGVGRGTPPWSSNIGAKVALAAVAELPGVWEARIQLPDDIAEGEYDLTLTVSGNTSPPTKLQVVR
ncbi:MAG: N-acetylmuramoyl-L-alanine amidase [Acidobacteria bacterium]|nr:N-acetylmuramoyl-L-alanine amidase [Acidobacteriota bacterium]